MNKDILKETLGNLKLGRIRSAELNIDFDIWNLNELAELNESYNIEEFIPGYFAIGSNGGEEMLTLEISTGKFYSVPFIPMDKSERTLVASSLDELIGMRI
ncbi:MAG: hypothetical protein K8H85_10970 [Cyclobacteriaceae bacterium]|nr:hypothetical protein [Cyclobacteriaceae bacterium]